MYKRAAGDDRRRHQERHAPATSQDGKPNVLIDFTGDGSKTFQEITRELYRTGLLKQTPQTFAIVFDNVMMSDPMIDYTKPDLRDGISGSAEISGGSMTTPEAKDLAFFLNTRRAAGPAGHRLPAGGLRHARQGLAQPGPHRRAVGLGIVLLYMLLYYRFLGLVADLALIVYAHPSMGPVQPDPRHAHAAGIAGMILTIGVAADANVVIFERIKEEVRRGKTVRSAVSSGYARGFRTILDANVLTMLTALVLFLFATAGPKGFAFTLIVGVIVSMLTAVLFTRAMLGVLAGFAFFNKPSFMGVKAGQIDIETAMMGDTRAAASRRRRTAPAGEAAPATAGEPAADGPSAPAKGAQRGQGGRRTSTNRKRKKRR